METTVHKPLDARQAMGLLTQHDIQPTQQRVQIARVLFARDQHLSADDVLRMVNQDTARVSKATVYNTLGLFASKGLVREVIVDPSRVFYDPNTEPHYHFYNVDTGSLTDIDPSECSLTRLPAPPPGTVTDGVDIIIRIRNGD
ncbi:transcriptional repressor [Thiohalobacter sp. COW1]|uniref:Fur family transcriptional regulator n=1 Tax=Thiohalobacter sp. COW1 TaxID=2795687 RepID=UPI001915CCF3|nr:Fur family transcriptional regulator [Thiohalobacter sp. COW1]BCO31633.1 transcriptional repressor [Thiohalobacter sp. COW1]